MRKNFRITQGKDYQGGKCYRVSYEEYDTLYTIPTPFYTKKMAREFLLEEYQPQNGETIQKS